MRRTRTGWSPHSNTRQGGAARGGATRDRDITDMREKGKLQKNIIARGLQPHNQKASVPPLNGRFQGVLYTEVPRRILPPSEDTGWLA